MKKFEEDKQKRGPVTNTAGPLRLPLVISISCIERASIQIGPRLPIGKDHRDHTFEQRVVAQIFINRFFFQLSNEIGGVHYFYCL